MGCVDKKKWGLVTLVFVSPVLLPTVARGQDPPPPEVPSATATPSAAVTAEAAPATPPTASTAATVAPVAPAAGSAPPASQAKASSASNPSAPRPVRLPSGEFILVPPGHHIEEQPRRGLIIGGFVTFGVMYAITALAVVGAKATDSLDAAGCVVGSTASGGSTSKCEKEEVNYNASFVPLVGPFITAASAERASAFAVLGVGQLFGVGLGIFGMLTTSPQVVPDKPWLARMRVLPQVSHQGLGANVVGVF